MDAQKIKEIALANGFSLKQQASGNMDLHSYVYEFADALIKEAEVQATPEGFVLVPHDVADRCMGHISIAMCHPNNTNAENDVMQMDLDILESKIEAQDQNHDS